MEEIKTGEQSAGAGSGVLLTVVVYGETARISDVLSSLYRQKTAEGDAFCRKNSVQVLVMDPQEPATDPAAVPAAGGGLSVTVVSVPGYAEWEAYEQALLRIQGRYVTFTDTEGAYTEGALARAFEELSHPAVSLAAFCALQETEPGKHKRYMAQPPEKRRSGYVSLEEEPTCLHLHFNAYVMKTTCLYGRHFEKARRGESRTALLLTLLREAGGYAYVADQSYRYQTPCEDDTSAYLYQHEAAWYTESVRDWLLPLLREPEMPSFYQPACLYLLAAKYRCNLNERTKGVLTAETLPAFEKVSGELLAHIELPYLFSFSAWVPDFELPRALLVLFLKQRAAATGTVLRWQEGMPYRFWLTAPEEERPEQTYAFRPEQGERLVISTVNTQPDGLHLDATLTAADFLEETAVRVSVRQNGCEVSVTPTHTWARLSCFGRVLRDRLVYHIVLPPCQGTADIAFFLVTETGEIPLSPAFETVHARLSDLAGSYWCYQPGRVLTARPFGLHCEPLSRKEHWRREIAFLKACLHGKDGHKRAIKSVLLRVAYWLTRSFFRRKRIWITFDKLFKAGDNGEYIYRYAARQNDGITPYYILKKDSPDYARLKKDGVRVLTFFSMRCLLTCLNAEAVLTTHANAISYCGFFKRIQPYFRDLFSPEILCIQHGLSTQSLEQFQNRLFDNLKLYCCASPNEIRNLRQPAYGFLPEQLKLTGLARYDGLISRDQKNILITPTWRRSIVDSNVAHVKKHHSEFFKNSAYFRLYDRLIHDETLISCAREQGYRITYLLHPGVSAQADDFDHTGYVDVVAAYSDVNYEKMLTEASLMVTDYSGVQFDFAYMRKPILYYHPAELPPHYEESVGFHCAEDGFGPIVDNHEELVVQLCAYMRDGCRIKPEYAARADRFFAFSDHDNCRRIYAAVREFLDEKRVATKSRAAKNNEKN